MSNLQEVENNQAQIVDYDDAISLKNFIKRVKEYNKEVLNNWRFLVVLAIIFCGVLIFNAFRTPTSYLTTLTFMVNEEGSGGGGGGGLLSYFGVGGGGTGSYNYTKVMELTKSREIAKRAFFAKDSTAEKPDYLINEIIQIYGLQKKWSKKSPKMADFLFSHDDFDRFSREENKALKSVHTLLVGTKKIDGLMKLSVNIESGIFSMEINSLDEGLTIRLLEQLYDALSEFYISETIEKSSNTFKRLKARTDSVRKALMSFEYRLAKDIDANRGLISREAMLNRNRLERELRTTGIEYGKLLENQGTAEFSLETATPVFQIIDPPIVPVAPKKPSFLLAIVIGSFLGIFLGTIYVLLRKIYRDAMEDE